MLMQVTHKADNYSSDIKGRLDQPDIFLIILNILISENIILICRHEFLGRSWGVTIRNCTNTVCKGFQIKWRENVDILFPMLQCFQACNTLAGLLCQIWTFLTSSELIPAVLQLLLYRQACCSWALVPNLTLFNLRMKCWYQILSDLEAKHRAAKTPSLNSSHMISPVRSIKCIEVACGWCQRGPDQHTLDTSGPTRCQYQTKLSNEPFQRNVWTR